MMDFGRFAGFVFSAGLFVLLYAVVRALWLRLYAATRYRTSPVHETLLLCLLLSMLFLGSMTMGSELFSLWKNGLVSREELSCNLKPFVIFVHSYRYIVWHHDLWYFVVNFFGNILLFFVPSILLCCLYRGWTLGRVSAVALALSLIIELIQLPLGRGTDIDDLWLNTLGAVLGYALYRRIVVRWPSMVEKCRVRGIIKPNG